jgi:hypothetical protein
MAETIEQQYAGLMRFAAYVIQGRADGNDADTRMWLERLRNLANVLLATEEA